MMLQIFKSRYNRLENLSDTDLAAEDKPISITRRTKTSRWNYACILTLVVANLFIFVFSVLNFTTSGLSKSKVEPDIRYSRQDLNDLLKRTSEYSPLFDQVNLRPTTKVFNGALRDNTSIYRMPPSPEVDAAWDLITTEGREVIAASSLDVVRSGKDPAISLKAPLSWGYGNDAFVVQIEVFHQIHCLNELRKEMFYQYYYSNEGPPDELHIAHKSHCIHMLLQSLMCNADVGIITHNWVHNERLHEPKDRPMPDFNVEKQCRNFDALLDWATENGVKDLGRKFNALRIPEGMKVVPGDGYI